VEDELRRKRGEEDELRRKGGGEEDELRRKGGGEEDELRICAILPKVCLGRPSTT